MGIFENGRAFQQSPNAACKDLEGLGGEFWGPARTISVFDGHLALMPGT